MSKGSILVVDDEKLIRWSLSEYFQQIGCEVQSAEDWKAVADTLERRHFDVILLDFKLPEIDGIELLERVRRSDQDVGVIMITAHSNLDHAVAAIKAGANDYIAKPFRK
jgi:DNA-binding NtrC family response regulator